jgi:hypothetical protein
VRREALSILRGGAPHSLRFEPQRSLKPETARSESSASFFCCFAPPDVKEKSSIMMSLASILNDLRPEVAKLGSDLSNLRGPIEAALQQLQQAFAGVNASLQPSQASANALKLIYVAILQESISKAMVSTQFNVATAINDLWLHLDSLQKGSNSQDPLSEAEMLKLQRLMDNRARLCEVLSNVLKATNETAKPAIRNLR